MSAAILKNEPLVRFLRDGRIVMNSSDEAAKNFVLACMYDDNRSETFIRGFFPKSFSEGWVEQRRDYLRRISDYSIPRGWTLARRTFGKTTLQVLEIVRVLCLRLKRFAVYTTNDQNIAEEKTESIRTILMTTPEIRELFGYLRPQSVDGMKEVFGAHSWRLCDPVTNEPFAAVCPKSDGQTVNGLVLYVNGTMQRPDLIVNDDGESRKTINNEELRKAHRQWMHDVLSQCVDTNFQPDPKTQRWHISSPMQHTPWNIRVGDTNKHDDAFLPRLAEAPRDSAGGTASYWNGAVYPVAKALPGPKFESLIPEIITSPQVNALYRSFEADGNPEGFWREFMCTRRPGGSHVFPATFQYYRDSSEKFAERSDIDKFIICDPALTEDATSAFSSMLAVGVDRKRANIYLRRQITERMSPEEFDDNLFDLGMQTGTYWFLIEGLKGNNRFRDDLIRAAMKRGYPAAFESLSTQTGNVVDIDFGQGKTAPKRKRAVFAVRLYRPFLPTHPNGHVWHDESLRDSPLEMQMRSYPNCTWWDALDCLGHISQAMKVLGIYFDHQEPEDEEEKKAEKHMSMMGVRMKMGTWRVC